MLCCSNIYTNTKLHWISKVSSPFYFCDNFPNCKPIWITFGRNIADKISNKLTHCNFDIMFVKRCYYGMGLSRCYKTKGFYIYIQYTATSLYHHSNYQKHQYQHHHLSHHLSQLSSDVCGPTQHIIHPTIKTCNSMKLARVLLYSIHYPLCCHWANIIKKKIKKMNHAELNRK